jgi:hypothetical protein
MKIPAGVIRRIFQANGAGSASRPETLAGDVGMVERRAPHRPVVIHNGKGMVRLKSQPLIRLLGLLWSRMGSARIYLLVAATVLIVLAAVGVAHLVSSAGALSNKSPTKGPGWEATPDQPEEAAIPKDATIAITEISPKRKKSRNGQVSVAVTIGVAPRPNTKKGEVEIRVFFFDLTQANEMRPTEAQVDYEWMTPVRDWTDPTPKYLVATYLGTAGRVRKSPEKLRFGGFVVRVYFNGQLQAERSEPKGLLAALRHARQPIATPSATVHGPVQIAMEAPTPQVDKRPAVEGNVADNSRAATPAPVSSLPMATNQTRPSSTAPYASPVPDKPGFVYSPHDVKFLVDVRGVPPGTEVNDPNTGKPFRVP